MHLLPSLLFWAGAQAELYHSILENYLMISVIVALSVCG